MNNLLWPASRLHEALHALVAHSLVGTAAPLTGTPDEAAQDAEALNSWLSAAAQTLGAESEPVETTYAGFDRDVPRLGPALIRAGASFLALLPGARLRAIGPDLRAHTVPIAELRAALCGPLEAPLVPEIDQLLTRAGIASSDQARARAALLRERLAAARIGGIWLLRLPPSANFWQQLRHARVPRRLYALAVAHAAQYGLWILTWWVVGTNVLSQTAGRSWLFVWALLLVTLVPFRVLVTWLQGSIAIGAGARLKQRLFFGAMRLTPDSIRHQGAGQLLGRVLESEAVEALALSGGFLAFVALIELVISIFVLAAGAGGILQAAFLVGWLFVSTLTAWQYYRRNCDWTDLRLTMTHDLVESMVGHRTRLAQLPPDRWHQGEDEALEAYLKSSKAMDESTIALLAAVPRGWLVVGLLGLAPAFISGTHSTAGIAIAVGGMLLAYRALRRCASGAWQLAGAAVAWQRASVLFRAATRTEPIGSLDIAAGTKPAEILEGRDLVFRYSEKTPPVLKGATLRIARGDRLVLEGASGGGKSTLVSLLAGLREAGSGDLRIDGLDRRTLGAEAWRRRIAAAPQFHENHVLAETFAFNLLMGRRTAPSPNDVPQAEEICRELGLGDLLERMPAGVLQMVGETGWQLSHGERSRLYIARALLQDADLVVLDESFAALDPVNLRHALECVAKRARSLLVISHR